MRHRQLLILAFLSLSFLVGFGSAGAADLRWQQIGPQPLIFTDGTEHSGQVNALAVDPRNSSVVYLGADGGGVWKTTDGGQTWTPLTDNQPSLQIGALALDPTDPDIVYVGTASSNFFWGNLGLGILKSVDGGATWTQLPGPVPYGPGHQASVPSLAVSPTNGNILMAGVQTGTSTAVYRSNDGGNTWSSVLASNTANSVQVLFDPSNANVAYASLDGVYKSTDGGSTWSAANGTGSNVLPTGTFICLGITPSSPSTLYAGTCPSSGPFVYKTVDGGQNWTPLSSIATGCAWMVRVDPANPNVIVTGSAGVTESVDGGSSWFFLRPGSSGFHGGMEFSPDGSALYLGEEGGIWKATNITANPWTLTDLNATLATQELTGIALHPTDPAKAIGGAQSNGMDLYSGALSWQSVGCDDGGYAAFDFLNPGTIYATCTPGTGILKSTNGGSTFSSAQNGIDSSEFSSGTYPLLAMDPSNPQKLYTAATHVWQTTDGANSWTAISPALEPGTGLPQALAVAPSDPNTVYLANSNGVFVTANADQGAGAAWANHSAGLPSLCTSFSPSCTFPNAIAVDPSDAGIAYLGLATYTAGHVYKTTNFGTSWTDISGNLPNLKVNDVVVDPDVPGTLYIATEQGVFSTADGGNSWARLGSGLPNVTVTALKLHRPTRILRAATNGRSAWDLQLGAVASPVALSSTSLSFTAAGSQTVTLTNSGTAPLTLYSITAPAGFSPTNTCGVQVLGGGNCVITVRFAPPASGSFSGSITITDDAPGSPQAISVSGTGTAAPDFSLGMASWATSSATVTAGQTASYALTVTPVGGLNQSVSLSCSGAPSLATCSVAPSSAPMDGTNPASVIVKVITTAASFGAPRSRPLPPAPPLSPGAREFLVIALALAVMAWAFARRKRQDLMRWPSATLVFAAGFLLVLVLAGCGGGGGGGGPAPPSNPGTPAGSYTLTVTGTVGSGATALSHNVTLTLNVS